MLHSVTQTKLAASLLSGAPVRGVLVSYGLFSTILLVTDPLVIILSGVGSSAIYASLEGRSSDLGRDLALSLATAILFLVGARVRDLYKPSRFLNLRNQLQDVLIIWASIFVGLVSLAFALKLSDVLSGDVVALFLVTGLCGLFVSRWSMHLCLMTFTARGTLARRRVVVLSDTRRADRSLVVENLTNHGYEVSQVFVLPAAAARTGRLDPVALGEIRALIQYVRISSVDEIVLVMHGMNRAMIQNLAVELRSVPLPVKLAPDPAIEWLLNRSICELGPTKVIELQQAPLTGRQRAAKRAFDITAAGLALAVVAPMLAVIALAIRTESPGPILFRQRRGGFNERTFRIYKFRTMYTLDDGSYICQARCGDPRVTRIGRVLRKYSLDELPQLLNVLIGDMSLVGPRPHAVAHNEFYDKQIAVYAARHNMKPGLTGLAQISGCRGETAEIDAMKRRIDFDLAYIQRWSLLLDLKILVLTIREIVRPTNAC